MKQKAFNTIIRTDLKTILFLICILFPCLSPAQNDGDVKKTEVILRGKALGFVIIEDWWVRSFSLGTEIRFNERFSFVADIVHFRWRYEREVRDLPNPDDYSEYSSYDERDYLTFEFRYYPNFKKMVSTYKPYITVFTKLGKRATWMQEKFPRKEGDIVGIKSQFYDLGIAPGLQLGENVGFDFCIGAAYRAETKTEQTYHDNLPPTYMKNLLDNRWNGVIRVNFYWNLMY